MSSDPLTPAAPRPALLLVLTAVVLALLGQPAAAQPLSTPDKAAVPLAAPAILDADRTRTPSATPCGCRCATPPGSPVR